MTKATWRSGSLLDAVKGLTHQLETAREEIQRLMSVIAQMDITEANKAVLKNTHKLTAENASIRQLLVESISNEELGLWVEDMDVGTMLFRMSKNYWVVGVPSEDEEKWVDAGSALHALQEWQDKEVEDELREAIES